MLLTGKKVLLGVTGGIAAYKAAELVRLLQQEGASVRVMMTAHATRFVTSLTFQALSQAPVALDLFDLEGESRIGHIALARDADCIVIAPATANFLAKVATGLADDLPSTVVLASRAPLLLAPAMNVAMWEHPATQANVALLTRRPGVTIIPPGSGELACGETGGGRLADLAVILDVIIGTLHPSDLAGLRLLVTSGPTREPLDPVRFLSNRSTGRMGQAIARVAHWRGASVTLVSGPVELPPPPGVRVIRVETARAMHEVLLQEAPAADALVMVAAVGDLRPARYEARKLRKEELGTSLPLERNPDLLAELGERDLPRWRVGFAAETEEGLVGAEAKLRAKRCHLLAYNRVDLPDQGFGAATNRVIILDRDGGQEEVALAAKEVVAGRLLDRLGALWRAGRDEPRVEP